MIKKDIRYIFKKVIIYVLVALILGFIGKNNVFADSVYSICSPNSNVSTSCSTTDFNYNNPVPIPEFNLQYVPKNGSGNYRYFLQTALYNEEREIYHFNNVRYYDNVDDDMLNFVWRYGKTQNGVNFYMPWAGESTGNVPNSITQTYDYFIVESGSANETWLINQLNLYTDSHFSGTWYARSTFNLGGKLYSFFNVNIGYVSNSNNQHFYYEIPFTLIDPDNWTYYFQRNSKDNFDMKMWYYNSDNDKYQYTLVPTILNGYSQVNLSGTQSVYFVPKDYNDIQIESIQTNPGSDFPLYINYIDFNYYLKGSVRGAYFPFENMDDMTLSEEVFSPEFTLVDSYFPMYEHPDEQVQGFQYYSYIIFNKNEVDSTIYYNSNLFDAYFIEDLQAYNEIICSIDRNDTEICFNVNFSADIENAWLKGFQDTDDGFVGGQQESLDSRVSGFFDIIKFPFNWLKSMTQATCSPLVLPIPFINGSFELPCLSSLFNSVLGETLYNLIFYIVNGFIIYRVTVSNIATVKGVLDPNDDKLEVLDL